MSSTQFRRAVLWLALLLIVAGLRTAFIFWQRHQPMRTNTQAAGSQPSANPDDFVSPRKIYASDFATAVSELKGKTVWVSAGNQISCGGGLLAPLERLNISDVVRRSGQIMVIVERSAAPGRCSASIGPESGRLIAGDIFFPDDPHEMYRHWPADVWSAIDRHEVKPGMSELQVSFAVGTSARIFGSDYGNRTVEYTNAGKPVTVTFASNRAVEIR